LGGGQKVAIGLRDTADVTDLVPEAAMTGTQEYCITGPHPNLDLERLAANVDRVAVPC
jgi:hypothetical protein